MERRLLLAVVLSVGVLLLWQSVIMPPPKKKPRPKRKEVAEKTEKKPEAPKEQVVDSLIPLPVREPECVTAACDPSSVRPALMTITGLVSATSRAADRNDRASPIDSM